MLDTTRIRLITLDLDDTLWDAKPVLMRAEQALQEWLQLHYPEIGQRLPPSKQLQLKKELAQERPQLLNDMTAFRHAWLESLAQHCGLQPSLADPAMEHFLTWRNKVTLFEGVETALQTLAENYPLIAISNGNANIYQMPIGKYFSAAFKPSEQHAAKPAPDMFIAACAEVEVKPTDTLHIGDDLKNDTLPAKQLGMQTAQIGTSGTATPNDGYADIYVDDLAGIVAAIKKPAK